MNLRDARITTITQNFDLSTLIAHNNCAKRQINYISHYFTMIFQDSMIHIIVNVVTTKYE